MTLHPNTELLQHSYDAFGRGDMQPLLDLVCDDIEWVDSTLGPLAGTYRGKAEVPQFFGRMMDVYQGTLEVEVLDVIANDSHGVVLTRESGTVEGDEIAWSSVHVFSFDGGRVHRFVSYCSAEYQRYWAHRT